MTEKAYCILFPPVQTVALTLSCMVYLERSTYIVHVGKITLSRSRFLGSGRRTGMTVHTLLMQMTANAKGKEATDEP